MKTGQSVAGSEIAACSAVPNNVQQGTVQAPAAGCVRTNVADYRTMA